MRKNILIIGGYGEVGGKISQKIDVQNNELFIGGRNIRKAKAFIQKEKIKAHAVELDVEQIEEKDFVQFQLIINCVEKCNEKILQICINCKIDYMDISPSASILKMFSNYKEDIKNSGIRLICGIGVASLSYLLFEKSKKEYDDLKYVDSFLTLGIGENHGTDAVRWMLENLNKNIIIEDENGKRKIKSVEQFCCIQFLPKRKHTFYQIDLMDSYINKEYFPEIKSNSWFSTDVNLINNYIVLLRKIRILNLLKYSNVKKLFYKIFSSFLKIAHIIKLGDNKFMVALIVEGIKDKKNERSLYCVIGKENAELTSQMVADIVNAYDDYCEQNRSIYGVKYLNIQAYIKRNLIRYREINNCNIQIQVNKK